jgi:ribose transport system substrate-binding protein
MRRKLRVILVGVVCLAGLFLFIGAKEEGAEEKGAMEKEVYAMNVVVSGVPFWIDTKDAWADLGEASGIKTTYGGPLDTDSAKQIADIDTLIAEEIDGLVIAPTNSEALVPSIDRAVEAGIPVITYLVDSPKSKRLCNVTSALEESSHIIGEYAAKMMGYKGKCIIQYAVPGHEEQEGRAQGFKDIIEKYPGMEFVTLVENKYDENIGAQNIKPLLVAHPDVKAIFGCNSRTGVGAAIALREMGYKPGEVIVTGWDYDEDALDLIKEGWIQATGAQHSAFMTSVCFSILYMYNRGLLYPRSLSWEDRGVNPTPDIIKIPIMLVTKENVDAFYRK